MTKIVKEDLSPVIYSEGFENIRVPTNSSVKLDQKIAPERWYFCDKTNYLAE